MKKSQKFIHQFYYTIQLLKMQLNLKNISNIFQILKGADLSQVAPYLKTGYSNSKPTLSVYAEQIVRKIIYKMIIYPGHQWLYIQENWGFSTKSQFFTLGL